MTPLYFGSSARPLYGVMHTPERARDLGVVLCPPLMQEYNTSHWALRQLASQIAEAGMHVLRFDFTGMGDSHGDALDASLDTWTLDAQTARQELVDRTGVDRVAMVGLRLGALVAARACVTSPDAKALVLWEPVLSGALHLAELERMDAVANLQLLHARRSPNELLGYDLSSAFRREIEGVREIDLSAVRAKAIHVFVSAKRSEQTRLQERATVHVIEPTSKARGASAAMLPSPIASAIAKTLGALS